MEGLAYLAIDSSIATATEVLVKEDLVAQRQRIAEQRSLLGEVIRARCFFFEANTLGSEFHFLKKKAIC